MTEIYRSLQELIETYTTTTGETYLAQPQARLKVKQHLQDEHESMATLYNINHPAPRIQKNRMNLVSALDSITTRATREIRPHELLAAMGVPTASHNISKDTQQWNNLYDRLTHTTPKQTWQAILSTLKTSEQRAEDEYTMQVDHDEERDKDPQEKE